MSKLLLLVFSFFCFPVYAENDKAFVWQVTSTDATLYLVGSIHFADKSFYPLRPEIEAAFKRSEYLVVELDINNINYDIYREALSRNGIYKDNTTIKDVVSDETWQQLRQRLTELNIDYDTVKKYKAGMLVLILSGAQAVQVGLDASLGIDAHFLSEVAEKNSDKKIIELETLQQQLSLFLEIPNADLLLKESLYSLDEADQQMTEMVSYWKAGDEMQMNKFLFDDALIEYPAFVDIYDRLIYRRNQQMTLKLLDMLKTRASYFVVVGSGHLLGEKGIVAALREKGYQVKRL